MLKTFHKIALLVIIMLAVFSLSAYAQEYEIYVGAVQITDENASDVLGDTDEGATVTYDAATNTLTLNNADISDFQAEKNISERNSCIYSNGDLNIELVGDNKISVFPDESNIGGMTIAVHVIGNLTLNSKESATLDIDVGQAQRETFGFYVRRTADSLSTFTISGKTNVDVTLSDFIITDNYFGNCIALHCEGNMYILDETSISCVTGNIYLDESIDHEINNSDINSAGTSVGISASGGVMCFDTVGNIDIYVGDADGKRAGVACFGYLEFKEGNVVVEMGDFDSQPLLYATVAYVAVSEAYPCIALVGTNSDDLSQSLNGTSSVGGVEIYSYICADGTVPSYTRLIPAIVSIPEVSQNADGEKTVSVKVIDGEKAESALVVFAAYADSGRMTDVKFTSGKAAINGYITPELSLEEAVKITVFVLENTASLKPLTHQLAICDF